MLRWRDRATHASARSHFLAIPFLEFSPNTDQEILRACGVPGFPFSCRLFPEPDVRERGMLQLRVIDRSDRGRNFAAKQSVQRIEDEYGLNANLFGPQPSKPL
jgi:hypothetical protein